MVYNEKLIYVDIQMYLLHYNWDYYFDNVYNIHVELDKKYYQNQKVLLYEHFSNRVTITFDKETKEVIFIKNRIKE
jgi:hypothetical protein